MGQKIKKRKTIFITSKGLVAGKNGTNQDENLSPYRWMGLNRELVLLLKKESLQEDLLSFQSVGQSLELIKGPVYGKHINLIQI